MARNYFRNKSKKWEGMGQTCLRSPCCPGTLYPGYSPRSLAGVSVFRQDWIMPILVGSSLFWRRPWWDLWTGLPAWQCSQLLGLKTSSNLTEARRQLCGQGRPESTWSPPTWSRRNWSQTKYQRLPLAAMIRWLIKNMENFKFENLKAPTGALYGYHVTERTHVHLWHPCLICFTRFILYSCPATWRWSRGFSRKRVYRVTQLSSPTPGSSFPLTMTSCPLSCLKYYLTLTEFNCRNHFPWFFLVFPVPLSGRGFFPSSICSQVSSKKAFTKVAFFLSRALWGLQSLFGMIPNVFGQGRSVKKLLKLEALYSQELGKPKAHNPEIGHLIILDRDLDW